MQNAIERRRGKSSKILMRSHVLHIFGGWQWSTTPFIVIIQLMKRIDWETFFLYDRGSLVDDEFFGDVTTFDTTYRTNAYSKPFVVIVGINQHIETFSFLFSLLTSETKYTNTYLLETFLRAMNKKNSLRVIINGDQIMSKAMATTFLDSTHKVYC